MEPTDDVLVERSRQRPTRVQPAKWLLVQAGIPQQRVVGLSGLAPSQVSQSLNGQITPSRRVADACVRLLKRPVEELFDRELLEATRWYPPTPLGGEPDA